MANPVVFLQGNDATSFSAVVTRACALVNVAKNLGIVVAHSSSPSDTFTIQDTAGNTWTALTPAASTQTVVQAWYCTSLKGGSNTVTITGTITGSLTRGITFVEWTVTGGTVSFDKQGSHGQTASTTQTTPASGTLSAAAEIVIGYFCTGVAAQTFGNSIGTIEYTSSHATVDTVITDEYVSATTSVTQAVTSNSSTSANGIVTFAFAASALAGGQTGLQLAMDASLRNSGLRH
jgi:hypothetical protein